MRTKEMRSALDRAVTGEQRTNALANLLGNLARRAGNNPGDDEIAAMVRWIVGYLYMAPAMIEETEKAGHKAGVFAQLRPLLDAAERYWFEAQDLIPDHLGLAGLLDDAYVALSIIHATSERRKSEAGVALLPVDLSSANAQVRQLIGEPVASQLDAIVASATGTPDFLGFLDQLMALGAFTLPFAPSTPVRDPIYGNASINDIVNARLGAMGVI